ncbi:MAG: hypothetical protein ABL921_17210 [Pirellula sp.]
MREFPPRPFNCSLWLKLASFWLLPFWVGCDGLPEPHINAMLDVPSDVVGGTLRREYVWRKTVVRETDIQVANAIDTTDLETKLANRVFATTRIASQPEWMDDATWRICRRYVEPFKTPQELMELHDAETGAAVDVCMDAEGNRIWTISDQIIEWDIQSKQPKAKSTSPIKNPKRAYYESKTDTLLLQNEDSIVRVSTDGGTVIDRWKSDVGVIRNAVVARNSGLVAVVADKNQLYALNNGLKKFDKCSDIALANTNIAVHPDGEWVLAVTDRGMLKWFQGNKSPAFVEVAEKNLIKHAAIPVCGAAFDRWIDPLRAFSMSRGSPSGEKPIVTSLVIHPIVVEAFNATRTGTQDWVFAISQRADKEKKIATYLQDFMLNDLVLECDDAWQVPFESFELLGGNHNYSRLAIRVGNKIKVFERQVQRDPHGQSMFSDLGWRQLTVDPAATEKAVLAILPSDVDDFGRTRNTILMRIIAECASNWGRLEEAGSPVEALKKLEDWRKAGTDIALLCSAQKNVFLANKRQGHFEKGRADLRRVPLKSEFAPIACFIAIELNRKSIQPGPEQEAMLSGAMAVDPWFHNPVIDFCSQQYDYGYYSQVGAVIDSIAQKFPEPYDEQWYLKACIAYIDQGSERFIFGSNNEKMNFPRILESGVALLGSNELSRQELEMLAIIAHYLKRKDLEERFLKESIQRYGTAGKLVPFYELEAACIDVKRALFPPNHQYKGKTLLP